MTSLTNQFGQELTIVPLPPPTVAANEPGGDYFSLTPFVVIREKHADNEKLHVAYVSGCLYATGHKFVGDDIIS